MRKARLHAVVSFLSMLFMSQATPAAAAEFSAKDLAAEESKFAAYSVKNGMRDAFVEFFADDSILLRPDPVEGRPFMRKRTNPPIVLDWKSQITIMSASHDFGMSTGPSVITSKTNPAEPPSYGQFFSVWQKQANGDWRVLLDHGISHGEKPAPDTPLDARDLVLDPSAGTSGDDAEVAFQKRTREIGAPAAYTEAASDRTRLLRDERMPINGTKAITEFVKGDDGTWSWETLKKGASKANDFLYVLGAYTWQPRAGAAQKGHYLRVWVRKKHAGAAKWILAGEVLTPRPPGK